MDSYRNKSDKPRRDDKPRRNNEHNHRENRDRKPWSRDDNKSWKKESKPWNRDDNKSWKKESKPWNRDDNKSWKKESKPWNRDDNKSWKKESKPWNRDDNKSWKKESKPWNGDDNKSLKKESKPWNRDDNKSWKKENKSWRNDENDEDRPRRKFEHKSFDKKPYDREPFKKDFDEEGVERPHRRFDKPFEKHYDKKSFGKRHGDKNAPESKQKHEDGAIRLNKYISHAGICSRREADELIDAGSVKVNGKIVTEMGYMVMPGDVVQYGGETLRSERKRYFLFNKPKGFITTTDDPQERHTVMMLMDGCCTERIYPVGRLDRDTTGLLLFTNDGELAKKLTHPSTQVYKIYQVELNKAVTKDDMKKLVEGIDLEDGPMHVDEIQYANNGEDKRIVGVELHSGRNRIVRRLFETLGYDVHKLDRVVFAGLTKKDLPRGRYRELTEKEVGFLKMV